MSMRAMVELRTTVATSMGRAEGAQVEVETKASKVRKQGIML